MTIYFVRHASAGRPIQDRALDEQRTLDKKGIAQCHAIGSALFAMNVLVDAVLASPFQRTLQTATLIAAAIRHKHGIVVSPALRPDAEYSEFLGLLDSYRRKKAILIVGHDLNLSGFVGALLARSGPIAGVCLQHAAVAMLKLTRRSGELQCYLTPDHACAILSGQHFKK